MGELKIAKFKPFTEPPERTPEEIENILNEIKQLQKEIDDEKSIENQEYKRMGYNYRQNFIIHLNGDDFVDGCFTYHKMTSKTIEFGIKEMASKHRKLHPIKIEYAGAIKL